MSIGQTYDAPRHNSGVPKVHDTDVWKRIVEAFESIGVKGNPTAIAKDMHMAQPSVRGWKTGESTPSRANILAIAKRTGFLAGYLEDAAMPKKASRDPDTAELLEIWGDLRTLNRGKVLQFASDLLGKQFPDADDSSELHRP